MDELIERFEKRALWDGPAWLEAARALRAFAEREKELVEALKYIAKTWPDDFSARHARATLSKHKEQK